MDLNTLHFVMHSVFIYRLECGENYITSWPHKFAKCQICDGTISKNECHQGYYLCEKLHDLWKSAQLYKFWGLCHYTIGQVQATTYLIKVANPSVVNLQNLWGPTNSWYYNLFTWLYEMCSILDKLRKGEKSITQ